MNSQCSYSETTLPDGRVLKTKTCIENPVCPVSQQATKKAPQSEDVTEMRSETVQPAKGKGTSQLPIYKKSAAVQSDKDKEACKMPAYKRPTTVQAAKASKLNVPLTQRPSGLVQPSKCKLSSKTTVPKTRPPSQAYIQQKPPQVQPPICKLTSKITAPKTRPPLQATGSATNLQQKPAKVQPAKCKLTSKLTAPKTRPPSQACIQQKPAQVQPEQKQQVRFTEPELSSTGEDSFAIFYDKLQERREYSANKGLQNESRRLLRVIGLLHVASFIHNIFATK